MQWGDGIPRDGTSRKMREYQIRFCEKLSVKFTGLTRQFPRSTRCRISKIGDEGGANGALRGGPYHPDPATEGLHGPQELGDAARQTRWHEEGEGVV